MLTANQLRQVAARSGARDIANVETNVILTHLLQLCCFARCGICGTYTVLLLANSMQEVRSLARL